MKFKKLLALLICVCLASSIFAGCSDDEAKNSTPKIESEKPSKNKDSDDDSDKDTSTDVSNDSAENNISIPANSNTDPNTTSTFGTLQMTKLPYYIDGILVESVSLVSESENYKKLLFKVTNKSGKIIDWTSSVRYEEFDATGKSLGESGLVLSDMNPGETAYVTSLFDSEVSKIILLNETRLYEGFKYDTNNTEIHEGITTSKIPYEYQGLKITGITFKESYGSTKAYVTVTNNTGGAIKSSTSIFYKCYNSEGIIIQNLSFYLDEMNNGDTYEGSFSLPEGTVKLIFGNANIYKK